MCLVVSWLFCGHAVPRHTILGHFERYAHELISFKECFDDLDPLEQYVNSCWTKTEEGLTLTSEPYYIHVWRQKLWFGVPRTAKGTILVASWLVTIIRCPTWAQLLVLNVWRGSNFRVHVVSFLYVYKPWWGQIESLGWYKFSKIIISRQVTFGPRNWNVSDSKKQHMFTSWTMLERVC